MKRLLTLVLLALPVFAQATLHDSLVKHWKTTADFTLAVADAMPADGYSFKPVPEEMSFSQVLVQIAGANMNACSLAGGMERVPVPPKIAEALKTEGNAEKPLVMQFLKDTFDLCNRAVASMTPEKLDAVVGGTRKMTGYEWLWSYFTHTAHHRGQLEVYLRVKGIKPPTYVF